MPKIANLTPLTREYAAAAVVADLELFCAEVTLDGVRWYDTRPMLDPREHSPECIDLGEKAVTLALGLHLADQHPQHTYLLRLKSHATVTESSHAQH